MELAVSREDQDILLKDRNVLQESVVDKYRTAGQIAQTALKYVSGLINESYHRNDGTKICISELCLLTDSFMLARLEQCYSNKVNERGIALPTSIDIDQVANGWCPEVDDSNNIVNWNKDVSESDGLLSSVTGFLRAGDVVKISLGVHVDGYTSQVSHTMVIYPVDVSLPREQRVPTGPLLGGKADAVAAAHLASDTVVALLACSLTPEKIPASLTLNGKNAVTGHVIRNVVDKIAQSFNCCVVPGSRVRRIRRFLAGQNEGIIAEREYKGVAWTESHQEAQLLAKIAQQEQTEELKLTVSKRATQITESASAIPTDDFEVQSGEVYLIDLKMSPLSDFKKQGLVTLQDVDSYTGKSHKNDVLVARSGAFIRDFAHSYTLKLKTSRQLLTKIDRNGVYPMKLAHLSPNFPLTSSSSNGENNQLEALKQDLKSFRLGMSEITNNYLCLEKPIQIAKYIPWDHILKTTNTKGNLSYDATASLTLPGHETPLPKLGISSLKLKSFMKSPETHSLPVARESCTVLLCGSDTSLNEKPELLRVTGGSKTCQPSWVHSKYELNTQDPLVQGIFQLAALSKDKRFGITLRETQPMKYHKTETSSVDGDGDAMEL
ncbi:hypothetical protein HG535_0G04600 [Zygotorulaspora mrakii]|uniref:Probable metalloprotease ARX1 n=1 Tax=Zygotorulaspora mrakii TaxID=42260 RepID=A0A7H9B7J3_ZYGMR|nr:uncharacterized protein HG535_0G04600 [Zygotorulaspora mrakii]QLG74577.1 hypothetical protein HG535_0G04600 [Zygotorulaspora mrakii]